MKRTTRGRFEVVDEGEDKEMEAKGKCSVMHLGVLA